MKAADYGQMTTTEEVIRMQPPTSLRKKANLRSHSNRTWLLEPYVKVGYNNTLSPMYTWMMTPTIDWTDWRKTANGHSSVVALTPYLNNNTYYGTH